ncbi:MAG: radical SAM protein [Thermodesulfobacteriota bacterium]
MNKPTRQFDEKLSPFLRLKLEELHATFGPGSQQYLGLARQYLRDDREALEGLENNVKHYEAGLEVESHGEALHGMERLYRHTIVIEPTFVCAAHCRYCLRSHYPRHTLTEAQITEIAKFCGAPERRDEVNEVLITGGDPLMIPKRLNFLIEALLEHAPNVRTFRIGSRLMTQYPQKVDDAVFAVFRNKPEVRFEIATQISHPVEFFPETCAIFKRVRDLGIKIYSQNVLLKGVNDDIDTLVRLYDLMRVHDLEPHYLFHCVPMRGIHHLRTSVDTGIRLIRQLVMGGLISGRAKPMFAAMTDIGKITFYEGVIRARRDGWLLLQSQYRMADRLAHNPSWVLPANAEVDGDGLLRVWYLDGSDEPA